MTAWCNRTPANLTKAPPSGRAWWDYAILACAVGVFVWLGINAQRAQPGHELRWVGVLSAILLVAAQSAAHGCLWRATRFS